MTFNIFLEIMRARWRIFVFVLVLTVGAATGVSLLIPKQYTATASVLVDVKTPDPIQGVIMQSTSVPGYIATQVDTIKSSRVSRKVIARLKLDQQPQLRQQWQDETNGEGDFIEWLGALLGKKLDVIPSRESSIISISYTASDRQFAAALANAYSQAYLEVAIEMRVNPAKQYASLFQAQSDQMRKEVEAAQARLSEFQSKSGLLANDERLDTEVAKLSELSSQLVFVQSQANESLSKRTQSSANSPEVINNALIVSLQTELSRQEARLKELTSKFGPAHPQVQEAEATIGELRRKISADTNRVSDSLSVSSKVNIQRLNQAKAEVEAQRIKVAKLKELRDQVGILQKDVENAQRSYEAVRSRQLQSTLDANSNQTNITEFEHASEPAKHSSPKLLLNIMLALFLGSALGVIAAVATELSDRRVRSVHDLEIILGSPVTVAFPEIDFSRNQKNQPTLKHPLTKRLTT
jgi:succinoglycan biosynthesis transport protein ExoP